MIIRDMGRIYREGKEDICFVFWEVEGFKYGIGEVLGREGVNGERKWEYDGKGEEMGMIGVVVGKIVV